MAYYYEELPSELSDEELKQNRLRAFKEDADWRERWIDFEKITKLYEATSSDTHEDGIPHLNLIRRGVEDYLSVALTNTPKARMHADRFLDPGMDELERRLRLEVIGESERVMNAYIATILQDNQYNDKLQLALRQAAVYGVGYLLVDIDQSADTRFSFELRDLFNKPLEQWTEYDAERFDLLTKRITIDHADTRDVFLQAGIRRFDEKMLRVSLVERFETQALRDMYDRQDIKPGKFPWYVEENNDPNEGNITGVLTTWQLEPVVRRQRFTLPGVVEGEEGEEGPEIIVTDWRLVKTVIAGGVLIEKTVTDSASGVLRLPIIPFYLRESEQHPYGFSIPLMLELAQKYLNYMQAIALKSAKKATSTQGMIVFKQNLGPGDKEVIDDVLENGGVGYVQGNDLSGTTDIREIVMPLNYNAAGIQPAVIQAIGMALDIFQAQSQSINQEAVDTARTGSAKRAQINLDERPKIISINLLSRSVEDVYDAVYENIRVHKRGRIDVALRKNGGGRDNAVLNQPIQRELPVLNEEGEPEMVGDQILTRLIELVANDTTIRMKAESEGRGTLPLDMVSRYQLLSMLAANVDPQTGEGIISHELVRDLTLDDEMKSMDDLIRARKAEQQAALMNTPMMQMLLAQQMGMGQQGSGGGGMPLGAGGAAPAGTQGDVPTDFEADQREQISELTL